MKATYSALMQSKYFNPAFNSAIFDGPVRIYFSQFHESQALKLYFQLQNKYQDLVHQAKELHRKTGRNLLIMLYPTKDSFELSFESKNMQLVLEKLDEDDIIGVNGPLDDHHLEPLLAMICKVLKTWPPAEQHHPFELGL